MTTTYKYRFHREAAINAAAATYRTLYQKGWNIPDEELYEELCTQFTSDKPVAHSFSTWVQFTYLLYPFLVRDLTDGEDEGFVTVLVHEGEPLTAQHLPDDDDGAIEPIEYDFIRALLHGDRHE